MTSLSISRIAQGFGSLSLDVLISLLGPTIVALPLYQLIMPSSATAVTSLEWILSVVLAGTLGFLAYRTWQTDTARVSWVIFFLWFAFGLVAKFRLVSISDLWLQFSGIECTRSLLNLDCQTFPLFTLPLVRGLSYSAGAFLAVRIYSCAHANPDKR